MVPGGLRGTAGTGFGCVAALPGLNVREIGPGGLRKHAGMGRKSPLGGTASCAPRLVVAPGLARLLDPLVRLTFIFTRCFVPLGDWVLKGFTRGSQVKGYSESPQARALCHLSPLYILILKLSLQQAHACTRTCSSQAKQHFEHKTPRGHPPKAASQLKGARRRDAGHHRPPAPAPLPRGGAAGWFWGP